MEAGQFSLRNLLHLPEHFARSGKVETAMRSRLLESGQYIVSPVDIRIQRGEFVVKRVADEALRREVIAFVGLKRISREPA